MTAPTVGRKVRHQRGVAPECSPAARSENEGCLPAEGPGIPRNGSTSRDVGSLDGGPIACDRGGLNGPSSLVKLADRASPA